jgi:hypothetical protein
MDFELIYISRSKKDVSGVLEIWRTKWLEYLEYGSSQSSSDHYRIPRKDVYLGCIRNFGSVKDILAMIEEGDQGEDLRPRVNRIRRDLAGMQVLQELWKDEKLDSLVEGFIIRNSDGSIVFWR